MRNPINIFSVFFLFTSIEMFAAPRQFFSKPADQVVYQAGTNTFTGITVVTVKGDGKVKVSFQRGRTKEAFEGTLDEKKRKALSAALQKAFAGAAVQTAYTPVPDEAEISVNFTSGTAKHSLSFWQNQAKDEEELQNVMNSFQQIAKSRVVIAPASLSTPSLQWTTGAITALDQKKLGQITQALLSGRKSEKDIEQMFGKFMPGSTPERLRVQSKFLNVQGTVVTNSPEKIMVVLSGITKVMLSAFKQKELFTERSGEGASTIYFFDDGKGLNSCRTLLSVPRKEPKRVSQIILQCFYD